MRNFNPEIVGRLLTNPKMEAVWREIGQYEIEVLPAYLEENLRADYWLGPVETPPSAKDEAAVAFFACVVINTVLKNKLACADISAFATRLANAAETTRMVRLNHLVCPAGADTDALEKAEAILAQLAAEVRRTSPKGHPFILERRRANDTKRAIVRSIASTTKAIFGKYLCNTVATAASVALKSNISHENVRDWCEGLLATSAK
jgi:hypothetical protein